MRPCVLIDSKALEYAEECTQVAPRWAKGYFRKFKALVNLNRFDEATEAHRLTELHCDRRHGNELSDFKESMGTSWKSKTSDPAARKAYLWALVKVNASAIAITPTPTQVSCFRPPSCSASTVRTKHLLCA